MKTLTVGLLLMGGLLMAQEPATKSEHISESQGRALVSQSPSVRIHKKHPARNKYQVKENKTTIVATKSYSK
jgi:hypothetical protein